MKGYKKSSILILLGVVGLLAFSLVIMLTMQNRITEKMDHESNQSMLDSTRIIQSSINGQFRNDKQRLESFARLYALSGSIDAAPDILADFSDTTDFYRFIYLNSTGSGMDSNGNVVHADALPFAETALSQGLSCHTDAYMGDSGRLQLTFQSPVWLDGKQVGALYADKIISSYKDPSLFTFGGGQGHAFVVNNDGSWIIESMASETKGIYAFLEENGNQPQVQEKLRSLIAGGQAGTMDIKVKGEESILCFLPNGNDYNWYLLTIMPKSALQQESSEIRHMVLLSFMELVGALVLITVLLLGRENMKGKAKNRIYREHLFQNISSNIDFAFLLYSPASRRVEMVSDNVRGLYGLEPDEITKRPGLLFEQCGVPEDDAAQTAFFDGKLNERFQKEYKTGGDGELLRWTEIKLLPADDGQYLAVLHDTTGEHQMREDLAEALLQSQENNRTRTAFFSSMSHDIRTPMNGIIGMTAIAKANLTNREKVRDCLDKITVASDHLLSLINEVLDMSRIESGKFSLKCEPVDLPDLFSNVLLLVKPDLVKKGQRLQVQSSVLDYDVVMGDGLHIQKILMNLLSNAIKYTPEGGHILIGLHEKKRNANMIDIIIEVEDNGIGMTPDFVKRIFRPFERAEDNRLSKVNGTGLGMAITKNIIDNMGGTIEVHSRPGEGSRFKVTLPMQLTETCSQAYEALTGKTVLVVDDSPDTCDGMRVMLEEIGITADCAMSGQEAVAAVSRARRLGSDYFAVILDWKMPEMDGVETARCIHEKLGINIPIILLSAYDWEDVKQEALDVGISGFLTKPVFRSELIQKLRYYVMGITEKPKEAPKQRLTHQFNGLKLLLAEDNELNREIAMELLCSAGIEVDSVENGALAVRAVREHAAGYYGLILMDIHMPVMNGLEAAENIRRLPDSKKAGIPIIAMTADAFAQDIQRCKNAGMDGHISKPINIEKMFEIIEFYYNKGNGGLENETCI